MMNSLLAKASIAAAAIMITLTPALADRNDHRHSNRSHYSQKHYGHNHYSHNRHAYGRKHFGQRHWTKRFYGWNYGYKANRRWN